MKKYLLLDQEYSLFHSGKSCELGVSKPSAEVHHNLRNTSTIYLELC